VYLAGPEGTCFDPAHAWQASEHISFTQGMVANPQNTMTHSNFTLPSEMYPLDTLEFEGSTTNGD
jgi:hypothetical protein